MKIPKYLNVLGEKYFIKWSPDLISRGVVGECDFQQKIILLDSSLKGERKNLLTQVLWHELIHAYAEETGINQFLEPQSREMMAETLANFIISLTGGRLGR